MAFGWLRVRDSRANRAIIVSALFEEAATSMSMTSEFAVAGKYGCHARERARC